MTDKLPIQQGVNETDTSSEQGKSKVGSFDAPAAPLPGQGPVHEDDPDSPDTPPPLAGSFTSKAK